LILQILFWWLFGLTLLCFTIRTVIFTALHTTTEIKKGEKNLEKIKKEIEIEKEKI
jgi:hypothetical protein